MIHNIIDHRSDPHCVAIDAVFEPAIHDDPEADPGGPHSYKSITRRHDYFYSDDLRDTSLRAAICHAESQWSFPVNLYLYDVGSQPLGFVLVPPESSRPLG